MAGRRLYPASVTPDKWDLFRGDSGTSKYTITVTKKGHTDKYYVEGEICVTNGGNVATENLKIVDQVQYKTDGGQFQDLAGASVTITPAQLGSGESKCYKYKIEFTPVPGAQYRNVAHVTITNHSGWLPGGQNCAGPDLCPFGPDPKADFSFPASPNKEINGTIHVDDTNGGSWEFSDSGSVSYDKTFTCDQDAGSHTNTATIRETGQPASATVKVTCYALEVSKDANTSYTRTYKWDKLVKTADRTSLTLAIDEWVLVNYKVTVCASYVDSDWAVSGKICVKNPAPMPAPITNLKDVACDVTGIIDWDGQPFTLAPGETKCFDYKVPLPSKMNCVNTATATLQNYDYGWQKNGTKDGTTDFTGSKAFTFNGPTKEVDKCIRVEDTAYGPLGTVSWAPSDPASTWWCKDLTYSVWVGGYKECGKQYTVHNAACYYTCDSNASSCDSVDITINVPCPGCTLTPGYWKTHSRRGPAPYDDAWALVGPLQENTFFFGSGKTYYQALWTPPAGNAYWILAHAYIAAYLNKLNGAYVPAAVQTAMDHAAVLLGSYDGSPYPMSAIRNGVRTDFINTAALLDRYNNGLMGVVHCSE